MGLFDFPLMPVRGVMWIGRILQEEAERTLHDPARIRMELEALDEAHRRGEIDDEHYRDEQQELINLLLDRGLE